MTARSPILAIVLAVLASASCNCPNSSGQPHPTISVDAELVFGSVTVGTQKVMNLKVSNVGDAPLHIQSATIGGGSVFTVVSAPAQIPPSDFADLVVGYLPTGVGPDSGTLNVDSDDPKASTVIVTLLGGPNGAQATLSPDPLSFIPSSNALQKRTAYVTNTGVSTLNVTQISIVPSTNPDFSIPSLPLPASVAVNAQLSVEVDYLRTAQNRANGKLQVVSNDPAGAKTMTLIPDPIVSCQSNTDCTLGEVCLSGVCGPCTSTSQCSPGQTCSTGTGLCASCTGPCSPGQTNSRACGSCGSQSRTCGTDCQWGAFGGCVGGGGCSPSSTQTCNTYGSQTCSASCTWGACSCPAAPACTPGTTQSCGSSAIQTCTACGQWGSCAGQIDAGIAADAGSTGCDPSGTYLIPGTALSYSCCLGLITMNVSQFNFANGPSLAVAPGMVWPPAAYGDPSMTGSATACGGSFNVTETIPSVGPCYGTYNLVGGFVSSKTWSGTLSVQFPPDPNGDVCGCTNTGDPCLDQSWSVTAGK